YYLYFLFFLFFTYLISSKFLDILDKNADYVAIYNRRKKARYIFIVLAILGAIPIFYSRIQYLPTILAITGAGIIISLKDVTLNIVGWFMIHNRNGFRVGDRVEIAGVKGEVINVGLMRFTLLEVNMEGHSDQSTNRLVQIPNHLTVLNKF